MESDNNMGCIVFTTLMIGIFAIYGLLKKANEWFFMRKLECINLPPGNLGWPFIGNMRQFVKCCKYGDPNSFISSFAKRYGRGGIYKAHMFGKPSIVVTTAETCKKVLMNDELFNLTFPKSVTDLIAKRIYYGLSFEQLKILRKITVGSIASQEALSLYVDTIKDIAISTWDRLDSNNTNNEPIELLAEMRKYALQVIMSIILGDNEIDQSWFDMVYKEFSGLCDGVFVMPINLPGFAYYKAAKARDKLCVIFEKVVNERRLMNESGKSKIGRRNILDQLLASEDEEGRKFSDEKIVCFIILYAFGGLISTAVTATWALIYLQQHPHFLQKAKEEQEAIFKYRPPSQKGLSGNEIKEMKYLYKVIDETLRLVNPSSPLHRIAQETINMNGYTIPKGWRVLTWTRHVHMDSTNYPNPEDFNPSRWDARDKLCVIFEKVVNERRLMNESGKSKIGRRNILDQLLASEDEEGRKFSDEKIVCFIILYAFGGLISTAVTATWALIYLQQHPHFLQKAKEEQEAIFKYRPPSQKGLSGNEIKEMKYLYKVIDETLRLVNPSSPLHRIAQETINMNGYTIPKGWRVLTWTRHVHMDSTNYPNPEDFNPSRWDDYVPKPGVFAPFGIGRRMCPGADLAKLEISVLLYYFLLDYGMERINPKGKAQFFPAIKHDDNCLVRIKKLTNIK